MKKLDRIFFPEMCKGAKAREASWVWAALHLQNLISIDQLEHMNLY